LFSFFARFCIRVLLGHTFFIFVCLSVCDYEHDSKSFIFSLVNKLGWAPVKLSPPGQAGSASYNYAIYSCSDRGPTFGGGFDIFIASQAASNAQSYTNLGHSYGYAANFGSTCTKTFLAGSHNFQPEEVEVFYETT